MQTRVQQMLDQHFFTTAREGLADEVRRLLAEGADLTTQDQYGRTALYLAIECDDFPMVQALIKHHEAQNGPGAPLPLGGRQGYMDNSKPWDR